jgi:RNA polymerase sigma-70 factor (ECF subfamily)
MFSDSASISRRSAELVVRAQAGEAQAYDQLFALAADGVLFYIRLRLRPPLSLRVEPLDVLQEAYLQALESFERFEYRGEGAFTKWLCRISERVLAGLADHHGARKRRPAGAREPLSRVLERVAQSGVSPSELAVRKEELQRLSRSLEELDEEERDALILRYVAGERIEDVAKKLDRSPSAVRRLLGRAMARLGGLLQEEEGVP